MENNSSLKVAIIPWLAMGHLIPFLELSKCLAKQGLTIYYITTPKNITRLPKIDANLLNFINIVSIDLPHFDGVPDDAESSMDVPPILQPLLKSRFDLLLPPITTFLEEVKPDWILYDFTSYWIPQLASKIGSSCAYISLFNAATMSYMGPPSELIANTRTTPQHFTLLPNWIPFKSDVIYRLHEVMKFMHSVDAEIATPDTIRFGSSIEGSNFVGIRTSLEFEPKWVDLLSKLYQKTVIPIGFLTPDYLDDDQRSDGGDRWRSLKRWLDGKDLDSVLYVAIGSESTLSQEELEELALGLELSGVNFLLVLRDQAWLGKNVLEMLPKGFEKRVEGRGWVHLGWAPQMRVLSHPSTRGFLTHCGWNSVIEGLGLGRVLVLLPVMNDQGLTARLLAGQGLGVEIERGNGGWLGRQAVAKAVRLVMVEEEGEGLRSNCRRMRGVIGDKKLNDGYIEGFIHYLEKNRKSN